SGEALAPVGRDRLPVVLEALQGVWGTRVVRMERQEELALGLAHCPVLRAVLAAVLVPEVADREVRHRLPAFDELARPGGRLVVHDQPFEVAQGLPAQAVVDPGQGVGPIAGPGEDGEERFRRDVVGAGHGSSGTCWAGRRRHADRTVVPGRGPGDGRLYRAVAEPGPQEPGPGPMTYPNPTETDRIGPDPPRGQPNSLYQSARDRPV